MESHPASIRFFFDFISPNAYLAWTQLAKRLGPYHRPIGCVPVLFAGLLKAHRRFGPAEIPAVRDWMFRNCARKAADLRVLLQVPAFHPFNPLLLLRIVASEDEEATRSTLIDSFFRAVWAESCDLRLPEAVARVCDDAGLAGQALVARGQSAEAKERLRATTEGAISGGVFGVPTLEIDGELFWGYDDFPQAEQKLRGIDRVDVDAARAWRELRPSATRPETKNR